jgi:ParB family transcriptional regulator, chromosome partitioning protein
MTTIKKNKGGLGRGLSALLEQEGTDITERSQFRTAGAISEIPISQIEANPFQPRIDFEESALSELAESIKVHGIIQPITVRKMGYERYQLISGERRTRAAILAGLERLPAYVRIANDQDMLEMALIENIQRENLNAIEVALSYQRLIDECDLKQDELGERVGKDRSTVSNYLRLLKLPDEIQAAIKSQEISMGHARTIAGMKSETEQLELFHRIIQDKLSVRNTENLLKKISVKKPDTYSEKDKKEYYNQLIQESGTALAKKLSIKSGKGAKGQLIVTFSNEDELKSILQKLS